MTKVFKFGGGSIKDAEGIRRLIDIVKTEENNSKLVIVVSAIGKTTNALEEIVLKGFQEGDYAALLENLLQGHIKIAESICEKADPIRERLVEIGLKLKGIFEELINQTGKKYDFVYDQVVSFGEILSTTIIHQALLDEGMDTGFLDARKVVLTNSRNRNGGLLWEKTESRILESVNEMDNRIIITQGFIGSYEGEFTTTLGREGSDFSGAIFASSLNSPSLTIWKDVPGIMNSDPKISKPNYVFSYLSYFETSELTYYGATVIHPKTIKPLAIKQIPIYVRSFFDVKAKGTVISEKSNHEVIPTLILKKNQVLISFTTRNFEFIKSYHLHLIFSEIQNLAVFVNLTQSSAISFSIVADSEEEKIKKLIHSLEGDFHCKYNYDLSLLTVKNYTDEILEDIEKTYGVLLKQQTRNTIRFLIEIGAEEKITFDF
jgi:aspartate kinase